MSDLAYSLDNMPAFPVSGRGLAPYPIGRAVSGIVPQATCTADVARLRVGILPLSGFAMMDFTLMVEAMRTANAVAGSEIYSWTQVSPNAASVTASGHPEISSVDACWKDADFDYIFVCGDEEAVGFQDARTLRWLRTQAALGTVLGGVGGGAFVLARAGLLSHHRVTLHWKFATAFAEEFPDAQLCCSLYEIDGARVTCGGGVSTLDMMHGLLRWKHGPELAAKVCELLLHTDIREGPSPQRLSFQARLGINHPGLIRVLEAIGEHLEEPLSRSELAAIAGVSERQLDRLFMAKVGCALSVYYLQQRLERARKLVIQSSLPLLEIAVACGFDRASSFSRAYRKMFMMAPIEDRAKSCRWRASHR